MHRDHDRQTGSERGPVRIGDRRWSAELPALVAALGEPELTARLVRFLHRIAGVEHAAVFHLHGGKVDVVLAASADGSGTATQQAGRYLAHRAWRVDPAVIAAHQATAPLTLVRTDIAAIADDAVRADIYGAAGIVDRLLLYGRTEHGAFGLSVLRTAAGGRFSDADLAVLRDSGAILLSIVARHAGIANPPDVGRALTSLAEIEACMADLPDGLPRREMEVCTRIIYGISTLGIALELEISEETVVTYRKRAYHRIGIATQRELILWYLERWNRWNQVGRQPAPPPPP